MAFSAYEIRLKKRPKENLQSDRFENFENDHFVKIKK
jgi:hypothetical protein